MITFHVYNVSFQTAPRKWQSDDKSLQIQGLFCDYSGIIYLIFSIKTYVVTPHQNHMSRAVVKWSQHMFYTINPIALRRAKTPWSFGPSECNRVKVNGYIIMFFCHFAMRNNLCFSDKQNLSKIFFTYTGKNLLL